MIGIVVELPKPLNSNHWIRPPGYFSRFTFVTQWTAVCYIRPMMDTNLEVVGRGRSVPNGAVYPDERARTTTFFDTGAEYGFWRGGRCRFPTQIAFW